LLWSCEKLARPTWRNLTESFETWAYRNGLGRQLERLERLQFLERQEGVIDERVYRLTESGRLWALGGRDPDAWWSRPWDGYWRLVVFDLPLGQETQRDRVRRYLRSKGFGYLQKSVWIAPDRLTEERHALSGSRVDVESLILLEARPCAGESDEDIVSGAWDFEGINARYARCLQILKNRPTARLGSDGASQTFRRWAAQERAAWLAAASADPLLPRRLLPAGYLGCKVWHARKQTVARITDQIISFGR
jgi:DNA-binding transcriptional regulator PaaX